jgi:Cft2 family RNA processing exonuclease
MRITFLGAAGTVTGSKYLLEHRDQHVLIDCGLLQGYKQRCSSQRRAANQSVFVEISAAGGVY